MFGYDNVEMLGADGQRSHVERRINEAEAAVVRRIFELCAAGDGLTRIAKTLNDDARAVRRGRNRDGRQAGRRRRCAKCCCGRCIAARSCGTRRGSATPGAKRSGSRAPAGDWMRMPAPDLRIVSDELWDGQRRRAVPSASGSTTRHSGRPAPGHRVTVSAVGICAVRECGGGLVRPQSRQHGGKRRVQFYGCIASWKRGARVCANGLVARMDGRSTRRSWRRCRMTSAARRHRGGDSLALEALSPERSREGPSQAEAERAGRARGLRAPGSAIEHGGPLRTAADAAPARSGA